MHISSVRLLLLIPSIYRTQFQIYFVFLCFFLKKNARWRRISANGMKSSTKFTTKKSTRKKETNKTKNVKKTRRKLSINAF